MRCLLLLCVFIGLWTSCDVRKDTCDEIIGRWGFFDTDVDSTYSEFLFTEEGELLASSTIYGWNTKISTYTVENNTLEYKYDTCKIYFNNDKSVLTLKNANSEVKLYRLPSWVVVDPNISSYETQLIRRQDFLQTVIKKYITHFEVTDDTLFLHEETLLKEDNK